MSRLFLAGFLLAALVHPTTGAAPLDPTEAPAGGDAPAADAAGADAAMAAFVRAWTEEDVEGVVGAFLPDAVVFDPVPPGTFSGSEVIRRWVEDSFHQLDDIAISLDVGVETGGPVAFHVGRSVFRAMMGDVELMNEGPLTVVWVRQPDGAYRISAFHASLDPEPDPAAAPGPAPHDTAAAAPKGASAAEEAGVRAAVDAFIGAWVAEDEEAVMEAFLPDAVAYDPVPPGTFEGHEAIGQWVAGSFGNLEGIAISSPAAMRIETLGPVAWVAGSYRFEARFGDQDFVDEGPLSMVWVRQPDGAYRLALFHASEHPEPAAAEPAGE